MTLSRMVKPLIGIIMVPIVGWAMWLNASVPLFGRLPSAPSLSRQAAEPASRLVPDGLQSTIAKGAER